MPGSLNMETNMTTQTATTATAVRPFHVTTDVRAAFRSQR